MQTYFIMQFKRRVYESWKLFKDNQNLHRISLVKQRLALYENKALAKPLLVLQHFNLSKAFQTLKQNIGYRTMIKTNKKICAFAYYIRVLRKSFYALRLNAAATFQRKKSKQLKRLMI